MGLLVGHLLKVSSPWGGEIPVPRVVSQQGGKWLHRRGLMWVWAVSPHRTT